MNRDEKAGIGAWLGAGIGAIFGHGVGSAIASDEGGEIGSMVGAMAGGVAGSTIAYNRTDAEQVRKELTAKTTYHANSPISIPLLIVENCYVGEPFGEPQPLLPDSTYLLHFDIANNGNYVAYQVVPEISVEKGSSKIQLLEQLPIGDISARSRRTYSFRIKTSPKLKKGKVVFGIRLAEAKGYGTEKAKFVLPTRPAETK